MLLSLLVGVALGALVVAPLFDTTNNANSTSTTINGERSPRLFVASSTADGRIQFQSDTYRFSFTTAPEYWSRAESLSEMEILAYTLGRPNLNTSEEDTRDTPNGFNTSADDRLGIAVYGNEQRLTPDDLDGFQSWQDVATPTGESVGEPMQHAFSTATALEAITADGIDSYARNLYFFGETYILEIRSSDVPKDELYEIAESFRWTAE